MAPPALSRREPSRDTRFCRSADGTRIAYAIHGSGPPLLLASCWLSHLEFDWQSPVWHHFLQDLGSIATVIRYDERGFGMSDWDVDDFGLEARVADLSAVIDAAGLDRCAIVGMSQGGPVAVAYAVQQPARVSRLILYGAYAAIVRDAEAMELEDMLQRLIRVGWARPDSTFRRVFTQLMIPGASEQQASWLDDLQVRATSADNAARSREARAQTDVTSLLADIGQPTLVIHARGDRFNPFAEGRQLAAGIPHARLMSLDSDNHITLADEPVWPEVVREIGAFISGDAVSTPDTPSVLRSLTARERDVLQLVGRGYDNARIAQELSLSVRTVERHLGGVYAKLGLSGRSARAAAVARLMSG